MSLPNIFPSNEKSWTKDVKKTLNYFKENLDAQFYIFTNVHYTGEKSNKRLKREADILLINKNGLMVIEVKEGLLSDGKNNFYQFCNCNGDLSCRDCKGTNKRFVDPFEQSKAGLEGIRKLIKKELPSSNVDIIQKNHGVIAWNQLRHKNVSPILKNQHSGFLLTKYEIQEGEKN
jgi:hypothetical protein